MGHRKKTAHAVGAWKYGEAISATALVVKTATKGSENSMGFTLSKDLQDKVIQMVSSPDWDEEAAAVLPDCEGMVLVKSGTKAFHERLGTKGIFMIPVTMSGVANGVPGELRCYVCTR
jgi:hypothetical protein